MRKLKESFRELSTNPDPYVSHLGRAAEMMADDKLRNLRNTNGMLRVEKDRLKEELDTQQARLTSAKELAREWMSKTMELAAVVTGADDLDEEEETP